MKKNSSTIHIRVYYEDTDCGNVVYYANYLKYMERGRTEFLREREIELADYHSQGFVFAVSEVNVKYRRSARYNDLLTVKTKICDLSTITMVFETSIYNQKNELLTAGTAKIVCVDEETGKAAKVPEDFITKLGY